ncbi:integrase domain-containing protein [Escherichia coli]|uniref:integrase domain-containing protein n=52 Tax=Enterobacteriaceae TaxID=543 RepID=UPI002035CB10|nr:integrase domain-containing protein [Escherichia coli]
MSKLSSEMKALAKKAGGSFKTVNDRIHITKRFSEHLRALNIQIQRVEQIRVRHIECYIEERLEQDIGLRTLQNDMAALQAVLRQAGRRQVVEHPRLTNKALGVSGASRNGTRRAITPEHYQQVMEKARAEDAGLAAALEIARLMGLRSQEAVQSSLSLKTWLKAIERGENRLKVVFGTKGGRPRHTTVLDTGAVRKALEKALLVADRHNGRLIDKPDLKMALESWHKQVIKVGLKGEFSPHSLRYAWAQDMALYHSSRGCLGPTSDSRSRWACHHLFTSLCLLHAKRPVLHLCAYGTPVIFP